MANRIKAVSGVLVCIVVVLINTSLCQADDKYYEYKKVFFDDDLWDILNAQRYAVDVYEIAKTANSYLKQFKGNPIYRMGEMKVDHILKYADIEIGKCRAVEYKKSYDREEFAKKTAKKEEGRVKKNKGLLLFFDHWKDQLDNFCQRELLVRIHNSKFKRLITKKVEKSLKNYFLKDVGALEFKHSCKALIEALSVDGYGGENLNDVDWAIEHDERYASVSWPLKAGKMCKRYL